jgi:hypothetical protein
MSDKTHVEHNESASVTGHRLSIPHFTYEISVADTRYDFAPYLNDSLTLAR